MLTAFLWLGETIFLVARTGVYPRFIFARFEFVSGLGV